MVGGSSELTNMAMKLSAENHSTLPPSTCKRIIKESASHLHWSHKHLAKQSPLS